MNAFHHSHGSALPATSASSASGVERALRALGALFVLAVGAAVTVLSLAGFSWRGSRPRGGRATNRPLSNDCAI
jgi:hypothetical protein